MGAVLLEMSNGADLNGVYLGTFKTADEAQGVRLGAEKERWGVQPRRVAVHG